MTAANPLGRGVHAGPGELGVDLGLIVPAAGAKVYQLGSSGLKINQNVFILKSELVNTTVSHERISTDLNIAMEDVPGGAGQQTVHYLTEDLLADVLGQRPALRDEIKQVTAGEHLHHDYKC